MKLGEDFNALCKIMTGCWQSYAIHLSNFSLDINHIYNWSFVINDFTIHTLRHFTTKSYRIWHDALCDNHLHFDIISHFLYLVNKS